MSQYEIENKAELCPVCNGTGIYEKVIAPDKNISVGICSYKTTCHRLWWKRLGNNTNNSHFYYKRLRERSRDEY